MSTGGRLEGTGRGGAATNSGVVAPGRGGFGTLAAPQACGWHSKTRAQAATFTVAWVANQGHGVGRL